MQENIKLFESQANFRTELRRSRLGQYDGFRINNSVVLANRLSAVNDDFIIRRSHVTKGHKFSSMCQFSIHLLASGNNQQPE